jgi:succinate dehydrogenase / fumarate reductase iron-sulfur subunit
VRDLKVDRKVMTEALKQHLCWTELDDLEVSGGMERVAWEDAEHAGRFADCILCGACSEACPQVNRRSSFSGAFIFAQVMTLNRHSFGKGSHGHRLRSLGGRGGIANCAGAENCERVCPRGIPLVEGASLLGWEVAAYSVRTFFRG